MDNMDWTAIKRKLTSRKLWTAVISFVTAIVVYSGSDAGTAERIASLIWAGASLVAYIFGEGLVDAAATDAKKTDNMEGK
jgi:hypothetical protein